MLDERTFTNVHVLTLTTKLGDLDVMDEVAGVGAYAAVLKNSVPVEAGGMTFRALDLPALIRAKRAAARPRDLEQVPELEALLRRRTRR